MPIVTAIFMKTVNNVQREEKLVPFNLHCWYKSSSSSSAAAPVPPAAPPAVFLGSFETYYFKKNIHVTMIISIPPRTGMSTWSEFLIW
jgi:hypothetical protein